MYNIRLNTTILILFLVFLSNESFSQNSGTILQIDSVSINEDVNIVIGWTLESDYTEGHFVINRRTEEVYDSIATVYNLKDSLFIDTTVDVSEKAYSYFISARRYNEEEDGFVSFASSKAHQTIFLENLEYNVCDEAINVNWANYAVTTTVGEPQPQPLPFDSTKILLSYDDEKFSIKDHSPIDQNTITIPVSESGTYCFKIQSFESENPDHTSTSNTKCVTSRTLNPPDFAYLRKASVVDNSFIRLKLYADSTVSNPSYVIHRTVDEAKNFTAVDTIYSSKANIDFDDNADFLRSAYRYYYEVLDSCKRPVMDSNPVSSMFLFSEAEAQNENFLKWNIPEGLDAGIDEFIIKRKQEHDDEFETIRSTPANINSYFDLLNADDPGFIYKIMAVENHVNQYGFKDTVFSNYAITEREVEIFIPNAFKPESSIEKNRVFKPVISNTTPQNYKMLIYNNWGQLMFQTDDPNKAWDGKTNGKNAPAETYLYNLSFETPDGKKHQKKGSVTLLR